MIADLLASAVRLFAGARSRRSEALSINQEANRPRVYFANHTSNLDFVLLWAALPKPLRDQTRPAAAHDYWTASPPRRWLAAKVFRAVLIERKHVTRTNNPLDQMGAVLAEGESLIIFPEGGRFPGPAPGPFKSGLYHLTHRYPATELVPVYIENLNRVLPKGEVLPIPLICSVSFGAPLPQVTDETKDAFLQRARAALDALRTDSPRS